MRNIARFVFILSVLSLGVVGGLVVSGRMSMTSPSIAQPSPPAPSPQTRPAAAAATASALPDLSNVAEQALRVSANIKSTIVQQMNDPFYRMFYGRNPSVRSQSAGSGVVVSPDGYILTNKHVIGNAGAEVIVTPPDGIDRPAKLVGIDEISDLAVVKVDARGLEPLPWGDSDKLRVAEWVLAIGNPFQLSGTVTLGIVSTKSRSGASVGAIGDFIQTDAAINPGNSGGALINARGELIGINTMIYSETGGYQGIGFAIPSNMARRIMDELIKHGAVAWGSIGAVQWIEVEPQRAQRAGYGNIGGLYVYDLDSSSSAYRAGLRVEDLVVAVDGQPTNSLDQLERIVVKAPIGSTVKIDLIRQGRGKQSIEVPVVSRQTAQRRR